MKDLPIDHAEVARELGANEINVTPLHRLNRQITDKYQCMCGVTFKYYRDLLDHTVQENDAKDPQQQLKRAVEILRKVDSKISGKEWLHGPRCNSIRGTPYVYCECKLEAFSDIANDEIKPFLKEFDKQHGRSS